MKKVERFLDQIAKRLDRAIIAVNRTIAVLIALLLLLVAVVGGATYAYFTDTEVSTSNTFTAGTWQTDILALLPGTSKATYVTLPGPFPPIASFDENGQLKLDFGGIRAGNSNHSPDVFRIKNLSNQPVTVEFKLSDNLIPLFSLVQLEGGNSLALGQEKRVEMKLNTSPSTEAGLYSGSLAVSVGQGDYQKVIPVQVVVIRNS